MTQRLASYKNEYGQDEFVVNLEDDGYDAYGVIQSYPLDSERYVTVSLGAIDFLIESLNQLKEKLEASTAHAK